MSLASWSVSGRHQLLSNIEDILLAVSGVLGLVVAHHGGLGVDTNDDGLSSDGNAGTSTTLSGEDNVFDIIGLVGIEEHILLVADSDTAFLSSLSISTGSLDHSGVFIAGNWFGRSILLWLLEFIGGQLESWWGSPCGSIKSVNGSKLTNVGDRPCSRGSIEGVLNLMNVSIPARHFLFKFDFFLLIYDKLFIKFDRKLSL